MSILFPYHFVGINLYDSFTYFLFLGIRMKPILNLANYTYHFNLLINQFILDEVNLFIFSKLHYVNQNSHVNIKLKSHFDIY